MREPLFQWLIRMQSMRVLPPGTDNCSIRFNFLNGATNILMFYTMDFLNEVRTHLYSVDTVGCLWISKSKLRNSK